ncbi:hypothetical protein [Tamlana flava]
MKSIIKISRHLNNLTQEHLLASKRIIDFKSSNTSIWNGAKRYAH